MDAKTLGKVSVILEALDASGRHRFLALAQRRQVPAGGVVFHEGDMGDEFFVIARGRVRISVDDLGADKEVAVLEHGSFFGEMAMMGGHARTATAVAVEDAELVAFAGLAVNELLKSYPAARAALSRVGLLRVEDTMEKLTQG